MKTVLSKLVDGAQGTLGATPEYASHAGRQRVVTGFFLLLLCVTSVGLFLFAVSKTTLIGGSYSFFDRFFALLLLLSEVYIVIQTLGYYLQVWQSLRGTNVARINRLARIEGPTVAVFIATYNEPATVIEDTIVAVSLLNYPRKQIYLNCDHQSPEQAAIAADIARRHQVHFIHRVPNAGYKAGGVNEFLHRLGKDLPNADLLCIFDADSIPMPSFLQDIVPFFDDDPRIAYVQAPQHYSNPDASLVAEAAALQQSLFGEFISEGKQESEAMFYTGTNVIFRVAALRDIGGLIIESITEDFATSMKLHSRGWRSQYCNLSYVNGVGPTTLSPYWTQQGRWALGNIESFFSSFSKIFRQRGFTLLQRWEYFLSGSYFFVGCNALIAMLGPAVFLLFGIRPLVIAPMFYLLAYMPQVVLSNWFFFLTMGRRGYKIRIIFLSQCLTFSTFPVFVSAAIAAITRQKRPFAVTPKGSGDVLPWSGLRYQFAMIGLLVSAIAVGVIKLVTSLDAVVVINIIWCIYHTCLLGTIVLFNQPEKAQMPAEMVRYAAREHEAEPHLIQLPLADLHRATTRLKQNVAALRQAQSLRIPQPAPEQHGMRVAAHQRVARTATLGKTRKLLRRSPPPVPHEIH